MAATGNQPPPTSSNPAHAFDDRPLALRAQAGDREAFARLVMLYTDRLHAMLLHLVNGDREAAAELTQEAFTRAFERLNQFAAQSSFYTWLYRLARNRALDLLSRRRPLAMEHPGETLPATGPSPSDALASQELRERLHQALARIDPASRELLMMREFEGWDYQQIAEILAVPLGTVKSRLARARVELRDRLHGSVRAEDLT